MLFVEKKKKQKKASGSSDATQLKAELKTPHFSCENIYEITLENVTVHCRSIYHCLTGRERPEEMQD